MKFLLLISNSAIYPQSCFCENFISITLCLKKSLQSFYLFVGAVCHIARATPIPYQTSPQSAFFIGLGILFVFLKHCLSVV